MAAGSCGREIGQTNPPMPIVKPRSVQLRPEKFGMSRSVNLPVDHIVPCVSPVRWHAFTVARPSQPMWGLFRLLLADCVSLHIGAAARQRTDLGVP